MHAEVRYYKLCWLLTFGETLSCAYELWPGCGCDTMFISAEQQSSRRMLFILSTDFVGKARD